ncbi:MAG: hypothetical protein DRQ49_18950 [Gammaproteobacteria bacterium]|nr:MAG: hypothetical protein DRQ49_18950 [Gammaproteobacteria bacterium]RKZ39047.1 MAG: hypothetical protein DRQ41_11125 [Gammaproteobacteria bacterium]RKZ72911.1 MAG: hypothetical protein DRQ57_16035 [Gammaproteobacteria bacterium]
MTLSLIHPTLAALSSLNLVQESKIHKLLKGYGKKDTFEASGVIVKGKHFYVVFDNLSKIAKLQQGLPKNSQKNQLLGDKIADISFEGITYNPHKKQFYVVIEALVNGNYNNAKLQTYSTDFHLQSSDWLDYNFQSSNKGFEGLIYVRYQGKDFVLGLCEGNKCKAGKSSKGKGRIQVYQQQSKKWKYCTQPSAFVSG